MLSVSYHDMDLKMISRFATIGPVAGAPNLGYLEVLNYICENVKNLSYSEHFMKFILDLDLSDQGAKLPHQRDRLPRHGGRHNSL